MFCVKCGKEIKDGARFCPECGTQVTVAKMEVKKTVQDIPQKGQTNFEKASNAMSKTVDTAKGIVESIAAIIAVILVVMALTGKLDDMGEELGNVSWIKGNDTKSAFADNSVVTAGDKQIQTMDKVEEKSDQEMQVSDLSQETTDSASGIQPLIGDGYSGEYIQMYIDYISDSPYTVIWYAYYDIDADGIPEFFVSQSESGDNTSQYGEIYTIEDGSVKYLGEFDSMDVTLYVDPVDGKVVSVYDHMGTEVLTYITKTDVGVQVSKQPYKELGVDDEIYSTPYKIESEWVYEPDYNY